MDFIGKVLQNNVISIPKEIRALMDINVGDYVEVVIKTKVERHQ